MTPAERDRVELFDEWAERYDRSITSDSFPLTGCDEVIDTVVHLAKCEPDHRVLDVGIGTANLAKRIASTECELWGFDFSEEMLSRARAKLPTACLVKADLLDGWPEGLPDRFDRIVSAYVFHEFTDATKLGLIEDLAGHLAMDGLIVIGDVSFPNVEARDACHRTWNTAWDEDEHYWAAESMKSALARRGLAVAYEQISFCGGVFSLCRAAAS